MSYPAEQQGGWKVLGRAWDSVTGRRTNEICCRFMAASKVLGEETVKGGGGDKEGKEGDK